MSAQQTGLFIGSYQIGGTMPGQPVVTLQLAFNAPKKSVSGQAHVGWAVNPPVSETSHVYGDFTYMTVMPKNTHILVVLNGYALPHGPSPIAPAIPVNLNVRMVLESNWKTGQANISFLDGTGKMHEVEGLPVKSIPHVGPPA